MAKTPMTSLLPLVLITACGPASDQGGSTPDAVAQDGSPAGDVTPHPVLCDVLQTLGDLRLRTDGRLLRDGLGREVLLRGVNTGGRSKFQPFFPFPFESNTFDEALETYLLRASSWGQNVLRLPFTWEALEPIRGRIDEVWLARYVQMIDAAGAMGLRVIVDFHQDVFARPFCGDGFPLWAIEAPEVPPPEDCTHWFIGYGGNAGVRRNFDRFWANEDGLRDDFEAMWRVMVRATRDAPNVIGYEIINEPGAGTADPQDWASDTLTPFYERLAAVIRSESDEALIFVDSTGTDALLAETSLRRPAIEHGLVFAPHFYVPSVILTGRWDGMTQPGPALARWDEVGAAWGVPVLLGEYGIRPEAEGASAYIAAHYAAMDTVAMHGTLWEYSATTDDWNDEGMSLVDGLGREGATVASLVRPYPAAVAGTVAAFDYDPETRVFKLDFEATPDGVTEVVLPSRLYASEGADAADVTIEGGCAVATPGRLFVRHTGGPAHLEVRPR